MSSISFGGPSSFGSAEELAAPATFEPTAGRPSFWADGLAHFAYREVWFVENVHFTQLHCEGPGELEPKKEVQ